MVIHNPFIFVLFSYQFHFLFHILFKNFTDPQQALEIRKNVDLAENEMLKI